MFKLVRFLKGYMFKTVSGPFFKLVEAVFELITPLVVAYVIDTAIPEGAAGNYRPLIAGAAIIVALGVVGLGFSLTAQFFASRASLGFGTNLRRDLYAHVLSLSPAEFDKISAPSLITRLTADVNQAQQAVAMFIRLVTRAPFIVIGATVMSMIIDLKLSLIFVGAAIVIGLVLFIILTTTMPKYKRVQEKLDKTMLLTREQLAGARVVRAFNAESREEKTFAGAADDLNRSSIRVGAISALLNPLTYALINVAVILLLQFGGKQVYYGDLTQGQIIALVNYLMQILNALVVFANLLVIFTKASASAARINEVFAIKPGMSEGNGATPDENAPAFTYDNVSFTYPSAQKPSVENVNLTVLKGESIGILGGTGSGKTTVVSLLPRLYDVTQGTVTAFGHDVREYTFAQLRSLVSLAEQKSVLFAGSIRDNMLVGKPDATDAEILTALERAQALDFVLDHGGLEAYVEAGGKNLSGGQRQRLNVARALVSMPKILILDDSSSALDFATDARLRHALKVLREETGMTTVTVSQRATTLSGCDQIMVLDEGEIVGLGKHDDLMASCEVYREIVRSQDREGK